VEKLYGQVHLMMVWNDTETTRQLLGAVLALVLFVITAPSGRRWVARSPLVLLLLSPLPVVLPLLFPSVQSAVGLSQQAVRFFALASLLQSLVLVVFVSGWERIRDPVPKIFLDVLGILLVGVALVTALWEAGVAAGELFAGSAVLTAVLGFALRDTLGNVAAGLAIHAEHPFELNDWIQYDTHAEHIGKVVEVNWRATKVITLDLAYVNIPNSQLAQASIRNFTKPDPWSRRSLFIVAPYEVPPQKVQSIMLDAVRGSFGVLDSPAPSVVTNDYTDRGIEYWIRIFTTEFGQRDRVDGMARDRIFYALARNGIRIPVSTHQVRMTQLPAIIEAPQITIVAERARRLGAAGVLGMLSREQLEKLASEQDEQTYAEGEQIIYQGEPGTSMFIITEGEVTVSVKAPEKERVQLRRLQVGEYFGEMSLMTGEPRSATVTAIAETRVFEVTRTSFREILEQQPSLLEKLGETIHRRLIEREEAVEGARSQHLGETPSDILTSIKEFFGL
jgi:small-conductance mechanosensitive channel/CRP-like cAMP-binding protein